MYLSLFALLLTLGVALPAFRTSCILMIHSR
jgi:hypothetical protein